MLDRVRGLSWPVWVLLAVGGLLLVILLFGLFTERETADPAGEAQIEEPVDPLAPRLPDRGREGANRDYSCEANESVSWEEAPDNVNTKVAMTGPVTDIRDGEDGRIRMTVGQPDNGKEAVTVVLTEEFLNRVPARPETLYAGESVCAIGVIQRVDGRLQLVVNAPTDLSTL